MLAGSLEDNILTLLVHSAEHAANIAIQIAPELFSTPKYRTIAQAARSEDTCAYIRAGL